MDEQRGLKYGERPGLRFACALDGRGGGRDLTWEEARQWQSSQGALWIHLERDVPEARRWLLEESGINPVLCEALLAADSRPRVEEVEDALLVELDIRRLNCQLPAGRHRVTGVEHKVDEQLVDLARV